MNYRRPPIVEAIVEVRCEDFEGSLDELKAIANGFDGSWKPALEISTASFAFKLSPDMEQHSSRKPFGFRLDSPDGSRIAQFRRNGVSVSNVGPYCGWSDLKTLAMRAWGAWTEAGLSQPVGRLAIRTLNRINIPLPISDFGDFLLFRPELPDTIHNAVSSYLLTLRLPQPDGPAFAMITQALVDPEVSEHATIILDIDLAQESDVPQNHGMIWERFEWLHTRKNHLFESSITDKTRELFK